MLYSFKKDLNFPYSRALTFISLPVSNDFTDPADEDSFLGRASKACKEIAEQVKNTDFLQTLKTGALDEKHYAGLSYLDAYYCFEAKKTLDLFLEKLSKKEEEKATDNAPYAELRKLVTYLRDGYVSYNKEIIERWQCESSDKFIPTWDMQNYALFERTVIGCENPIYALVAFLPCYYLWPWFSKEIKEDPLYHPSHDKKDYSDWFDRNYSDDSNFDKPKQISKFIDKWIKDKHSWKEDSALSIFKQSMEYELSVFKNASTYVMPDTVQQDYTID